MTLDIAVVLPEVPRLLAACVPTLAVAAAALLAGLAGALLLTLLRLLKFAPLSAVIGVLTSAVFGTPPLLVIFVSYYVLPLAGIDLPPLAAGTLAIGLISACFLAEVMRAGLATIPDGQVEAGVALGLRGHAIWGRIILPQLLRVMAPNIVNEFTVVVKATALLSAITVTELMRTAQQIYAVNYRPLETLLVAAAIYAAVNLAASAVAAFLDRSRSRPRSAAGARRRSTS